MKRYNGTTWESTGAQLHLTGNDITNDSNVTGTKVKDVLNTLDGQITALQSADNNIFGTSDAWANDTSYTVGAYRIYSNALYRCILAHSTSTASTILPTNTAYWEKVSLVSKSVWISPFITTSGTVTVPNLNEYKFIEVVISPANGAAFVTNILPVAAFKTIYMKTAWGIEGNLEFTINYNGSDTSVSVEITGWGGNIILIP